MPQLKAFGPGIWLVDGSPLIAAVGFHYPTRMAVVRLAGGGLFIWSAVELTDALRAEVDSHGPIEHVVAPNSLHHVHLSGWTAAYPDAVIHPAPGLRSKRPDISFGDDLADEVPAAWAGEIDQAVVGGNAITTEVVFFHRESGTAIFTDLIQHFRPGWFSGWRSVVARLDLMVAAEPAVPRKFRLAFRDRSAARDAIGRILGWNIRNLVIAHGEPVMGVGDATVRRAFDWLLR